MKKQELSLAEIRRAIAAADAERTQKELTPEQRQVLEQTCVTLRDAERSAVTDKETGLIKGFSDSAQSVSLQAKKIRETVARMNKIPKVLDTTETVIKECVRVLKAIATWVLCLVILAGCSTLSKSQLKKISSFATVQDSLLPAAIFQTLDDVRLERGLIYSASLTDTESRIHELNSLAEATVKQEKTSAKANVCFNILSSYASALKSLSADTRWKKYGTELRGIGRNIDSVAIAYNKLDWGTLYDPGMAKNLGKTSGYLTEQYMKRRQRRLVYDVLVTGDTIVATCCDALIAGFKSADFLELIDNEEEGLENDYRAYLNSMQVLDRAPAADFDKVYLTEKAQIEKARQLRKKNISMLQSLKKAHAALVREMDKPRTYSEYSSDLIELNGQIHDLAEIYSTLKTAK
ncbi:MAG: hypothetical protein MJY96_10120 [Bacteroidaceae bacterium]|nr:hypothetical protein [Bacteroidaceae bacterium]